MADIPENLAKSQALISVEFEVIYPPTSPTDRLDKTLDNTEMRILNLQFNSLDFIGEPLHRRC